MRENSFDQTNFPQLSQTKKLVNNVFDKEGDNKNSNVDGDDPDVDDNAGESTQPTKNWSKSKVCNDQTNVDALYWQGGRAIRFQKWLFFRLRWDCWVVQYGLVTILLQAFGCPLHGASAPQTPCPLLLHSWLINWYLKPSILRLLFAYLFLHQ